MTKIIIKIKRNDYRTRHYSGGDRPSPRQSPHSPALASCPDVDASPSPRRRRPPLQYPTSAPPVPPVPVRQKYNLFHNSTNTYKNITFVLRHASVQILIYEGKTPTGHRRFYATNPQTHNYFHTIQPSTPSALIINF